MTLPVAMVGIGEMWPILIVVVLLFGAQRLPGLARSMGEGIKEFKKGVREIQEDEEKPASETKTA
jgi:sec-independent protein translocase protein TatA